MLAMDFSSRSFVFVFAAGCKKFGTLLGSSDSESRGSIRKSRQRSIAKTENTLLIEIAHLAISEFAGQSQRSPYSYQFIRIQMKIRLDPGV
jgi:hypothetical protein